MRNIYFKAKKGNLGDDLNGWLWPRIFGEIMEKNNTCFLGIGTMLTDESSLIQSISKESKIVFGSGARPSEFYLPFTPDEKYDIKFLRGPLSSMMLGNKFEYISDAAYAIRQWKEFNKMAGQKKKYEVSLIPYFHSVPYFNWKKLCNRLGYHYISPLCESGVEFTLNEIASSKHIISEAMHGAILADAFRVPWHRFILTTPHTEGPMVSEFKWRDWLGSIEVYQPDTTFIPFYKKSRVNLWIKTLTFDAVSTEFFLKPHTMRGILKKLALPSVYHLSSEKILSSIDERISRKIDEVMSQNQIS